MTNNRWSQLLIRHPVLVLCAFILAALAVGSQARNFEVDASADTLLTRGNEHYINTQLANRRFSPDEFILLAYEPISHDLFSEQTYEDIRAISKELAEFERVKSIQSILTVPLLSAESGLISADTDLSSLTLEAQGYDSETMSAIFRDHPIFEDLLVNADQTATAIQLSFRKNSEIERLNSQIIDLEAQALESDLSTDQEQELDRLRSQIAPLQKALDEQRNSEIKAIREIVTGYEDTARIRLGGAHVLGFQLIQIIENDLIVFGTAIAVMICLVLLVVFRNIRWILIPVVCCSLSVLATMGLLAMLQIKATVISANFIALQLILTLAIVVHMIVQYREFGRQDEDANVHTLVQRTLQAKIAPCFYAALTTSIGFASLLLSGIQPVISFGYMMILAMAVSIITSLVLFPAMMVLFTREAKLNRNRFTTWIVERLCNLVLKRPLLTAVAASVGMAILILGIYRLTVENSFINYFSEDTEVHEELSFIDEELGGSTPLDIVYHYDNSESSDDIVISAESVLTMQKILANLRQREAMGKVLSVANFTETAREMNDDKPLTEYELTALYLTMEASLRDELLGSFIDTESGEVRISTRIKDSTEGLNRRAFLNDVRNDVGQFLEADSNLRLTNLFVLYQDVLQKLYQSQILTLGIVFFVLTLAFAIIFRSLRTAVLAMTPNLLATMAILGLMGWFAIPLDLMTITVAAIAMGIAVDDTIHYVHRYQQEAQEHSPKDAVDRTHRSVGYAIVYTSLIVMLGFSLLGFSDFNPSVYFGLLIGLAMLFAMLSNLTLLPVLLLYFDDT